MEFKDIIGNTKAKDYLIKSIEKNDILHSYLFLGTEGIGKFLIAKEFAKKMLCLNLNATHCECKSCKCCESENHPDLVVINEENESIKIEQIRKITGKVIEKPIISSRKVYIINNSEKMTSEAQNCLLKTLEEPPEFIVVILISSNENMILNTIKSRCMSIKFKNISDKELRDYAIENIGYTDLTDNLLKSFNGSIGKAIELKENKEKYLKIEELISDFEKKDLIDIMLDTKILYDKENIYNILDYVIVCLHSKNSLRHINCISEVNNCIKKLKSNSNFDMCVDTMIFNIWEELNEDSNRN